MQLSMNDKVDHFVVGLILGGLTGILTGSPMLAIIVALVAGIFKEVYDNLYGGDVELLDAISTTAGGLVSGGLLKFIQYMGS